MVRQRKIDAQNHLLTLFIAGLAITVYFFPLLSDLFVYDRKAILKGELWRLLTAPFVHFSGSHIFWNLLIFLLAGFAVNRSKFICFWIVCSLSISLPGLICLLVIPDIEYYGGISGVATGAAAYYCLYSFFNSEKRRGIWLIMLVVIFSKILIETVMNESIFARTGEIPFRVLPEAHVAGCLGAIAALIWARSHIKLQEP
jgi:rhomboid family GlyGly-CTERM serine protease